MVDHVRTAGAGLVTVLALSSLAACGDEGSVSADQSARARAMGVAVDLVYVTDLDGYHRATGAAGAYGDSGFQDIYTSSHGEIRLTVEHRTLTTADCPRLPIPAAEPAGASVQCTRDGEAWRRTSGDRREYALFEDDRLIRASARTATPFDQLRRAARNAHPATGGQLDDLLPPSRGGGGTPPPRGDLPSTGDGAPNNEPGAGG